MKLLSGRALSAPEGTQTSHRLSMSPARAAVCDCRFEIKFEMNRLKSWESNEGLQQGFCFDCSGERGLIFLFIA